jgi:cysteine/glycine-rich protein
MSLGGGGSKCTICEKTSYPAETVSFEKKPYHIECFRCSDCDKKTSQGDMKQFEDKLYCGHCFQKGGFAQKQKAVKWTKKEGGTSNALASRFGGGGAKCVVCDKTAYTAEQISYDKKIFHHQCFKCTKCEKKISGAANAKMYEDNLFCDKCFKQEGYAQKQRNVTWTKKEGSSSAISSKFGGGGTSCTVCNKTVYQAEMVSFEKRPYHAACFMCNHCDKKVQPANAALHEDKVYCRKCFVAEGYNRAQVHTEKKTNATYDSRFAKFGGGGNKCKKCEKTVYPAETVSFEKNLFHPQCFTCDKCEKKLNPSSAEWHKENQSIHCKSCFQELGLNRP